MRTRKRSTNQPVTNVSDANGSIPSFAETALRLGGKSNDEASRTGKIDSADEQVEAMFANERGTSSSPIHRAVWDPWVSTDLFQHHQEPASEDTANVINRSLATVSAHRRNDTLLNDEGKIAPSVLNDLGVAGYWGLLVDRRYGGSGASMQQFCRMVTLMASIEPTVAGLASVHGCIGAVDPVRSFGNEEQKQRFLPKLASGERLSAFALTEPGAGSDLTALRTTAVLDGNEYVINGEKLFITNAVPGRTIGLVCKIDQTPAVLIVDLPEEEDNTFQLKRYGLYALKRAENNGLLFRNFRVPAKNLLKPSRGDGLTIAYHGLNRGRVALCANAAGTMRWMLAEMLPWSRYRRTYGQPIDQRELVRRRLGHLAGLIVACDALTQWCAGLLDEGYRGEMECIVAKIFGSEAQKTAAIELLMKTHGGRSFLHGHPFGDNVHEFLAPCIYEGEGEMLGLAFFKSLVKEHGKRYFEPIGRVLHELNVRQPNLANPAHLWAMRGPLMDYAAWWSCRRLRGSHWTPLSSVGKPFASHVHFAQREMSVSAIRISSTMRRHQLKLADRQCRMSAISERLQHAIVMLVTGLYGSRADDPVTREAADGLCRQLRSQLAGDQSTDADFRRLTQLGATIADEGWSELAGVGGGALMMPYQDSEADREHEIAESY